ncbi:hypothetical protein HMPREF9057_01814 [Actinomyces sp. oral taxon 171 str. F0337]|nr:hypothetical protein HMPREF9057_01814 [Actinomyces sp. oral taxon 171 str. F0337]
MPASRNRGPGNRGLPVVGPLRRRPRLPGDVVVGVNSSEKAPMEEHG